jgi:hypothetical protein
MLPSPRGTWHLSVMRTPVALPPPLKEWSSAMAKRRHFKHTSSLEERLAKDTKQLREQIKILPLGASRDDLLRRIRQNEIASHMDEWLRSPGLQSSR